MWMFHAWQQSLQTPIEPHRTCKQPFQQFLFAPQERKRLLNISSKNKESLLTQHIGAIAIIKWDVSFQLEAELQQAVESVLCPKKRKEESWRKIYFSLLDYWRDDQVTGTSFLTLRNNYYLKQRQTRDLSNSFLKINFGDLLDDSSCKNRIRKA